MPKTRPARTHLAVTTVLPLAVPFLRRLAERPGPALRLHLGQPVTADNRSFLDCPGDLIGLAASDVLCARFNHRLGLDWLSVPVPLDAPDQLAPPDGVAPSGHDRLPPVGVVVSLLHPGTEAHARLAAIVRQSPVRWWIDADATHVGRVAIHRLGRTSAGIKGIDTSNPSANTHEALASLVQALDHVLSAP